MKVKKKHLTGQISDFPKRVVQAMVDEQVRQGNPADPSVFAKYSDATKTNGGFDWGDSSLGGDAWYRVIGLKKFRLVSKPEKPKGHPYVKLMKQYLKDAKVSKTPWDKWECKASNLEMWQPLETHPRWDDEVDYRRKIETQADNKEQPTPNEIIQAMLDKGMTVWACTSDDSYDYARTKLGHYLYRVVGYDAVAEHPVRTRDVGWKYAVPVDTATMTEITEVPK